VRADAPRTSGKPRCADCPTKVEGRNGRIEDSALTFGEGLIMVAQEQPDCEHQWKAAMRDYGEDYWADRRYGGLDPEGHLWWITQRVRNPPVH
jgi:hypothetical protein